MKRILGLFLTVSLSVAVLACGHDEETVPETSESPYLPRTSIENVMANLATAYQERNLEEYAKLFDHDRFRYVFPPACVQGPDPLPPFWAWNAEYESAGNMLADTLIEKVELGISFQTPRPVEEADDPPAGATRTTYLTSLDLLLTTRNPDTEEQDIFVIQGEHQDFFFARDPWETQDGQPVWKVLEWRDREPGCGEWARLKYSYR
jgi:hypothetical protein